MSSNSEIDPKLCYARKNQAVELWRVKNSSYSSLEIDLLHTIFFSLNKRGAPSDKDYDPFPGYAPRLSHKPWSHF